MNWRSRAQRHHRVSFIWFKNAWRISHSWHTSKCLAWWCSFHCLVSFNVHRFSFRSFMTLREKCPIGPVISECSHNFISHSLLWKRYTTYSVTEDNNRSEQTFFFVEEREKSSSLILQVFSKITTKSICVSLSLWSLFSCDPSFIVRARDDAHLIKVGVKKCLEDDSFTTDMKEYPLIAKRDVLLESNCETNLWLIGKVFSRDQEKEKRDSKEGRETKSQDWQWNKFKAGRETWSNHDEGTWRRLPETRVMHLITLLCKAWERIFVVFPKIVVEAQQLVVA